MSGAFHGPVLRPAQPCRPVAFGADAQPHRSGERQALPSLQKIILQQTITGHPDAALFDFEQGDVARAEVQHLDGL